MYAVHANQIHKDKSTAGNLIEQLVQVTTIDDKPNMNWVKTLDKTFAFTVCGMLSQIESIMRVLLKIMDV